MSDQGHDIRIVETADGRFCARCDCGWSSRPVSTEEVASFHGDRHLDAHA